MQFLLKLRTKYSKSMRLNFTNYSKKLRKKMTTSMKTLFQIELVNQ